MAPRALPLSSRRIAVAGSASARRCLRRRETSDSWCDELDALEILGGLLGGSLFGTVDRQYAVGTAAKRSAPTDRAAADAIAADLTYDTFESRSRDAALSLAEDAALLAQRGCETDGWSRVGLYLAAIGAGVCSIGSGLAAGVPRGYAAAALVPSAASPSSPRLRDPDSFKKSLASRAPT